MKLSYKQFGISTSVAFAVVLSMPTILQAQTTEVDTPRNETLIVDMLGGTLSTPEMMNPYIPER